MKLLLPFFAFCLLFLSCEETHKPIKQWSVANEGVFSAQLSQNAENLLIGSYTHGASFWNTKKYQRLYNWNHAEGLFTPIFFSVLSKNGKIALTADERDFAVWNTLSGESIGFWSASDEIINIDIDKNGDLAAISTKNHKVTIVELQHGGIISQIVLPTNADKIQLTDSARFLLTTGSDLKLSVWDVLKKEVLYDIKLNQRAEYLKISEEYDLIFVQPYRKDASIYKLSTGEYISSINTKNKSVTHAEFTNEGKRLIFGTNTNSIELWQPLLSKKIKQWQLPKISKSQFSSDSILDIKAINKRYLVISTDGFLYLL
ncbi:MAG: WD40 repeat domain-containing protein [Saccharospirillaceae bacterium]|nr:WD40 repeat domain-containing protein [Pseudomonadales bacterium]NRB80300.1 WD40 repeat domain-containing protein [Saccharospirillaceae bacterium]